MIFFIIGGTFVYNIDLSFYNKVSLLTLANIEALAKEENTTTCLNPTNVPDRFKSLVGTRPI